jgi:predicted negative regulator of RcsB-dependent stress response
MKRLILLVIIGILAWQGYTKYQTQRLDHVATEAIEQTTAPTPEKLQLDSAESAKRFSCDGRTYCSQMTSCAEATYFLKNCPGVKMDGNHDGVPCEQQFCH